jgi:uncharacterized membrane protein YkoI
MQKYAIAPYVFLVVLAGFALTEANTMALALTDVPPAVQKTIGDNSAGRTVSTIDRVDDNGDVSYEVSTLSQDGKEWDLTVGENGTLLGMDVAFSDLPAAVQTAINAQVGQGKLEGVQKQFDDGETTYQAGITAPNADERDFSFNEDGTLASEEVYLSELPPEIQTPINSLVGKGKLEGIDKTFDDGEVTYDGTLTTPAGLERDFSLSDTGALLSEEVSLSDLPPAVQAGIKAQEGQGKLDGIDETFDDGGIAYEATVTAPDGQDHNVTVGPNGKLLSVEVRLAELSPAVQTAINAQVGQGKLEEIDQNFGPAGHTDECEMTTPDGQERDFVVSAQGVLLSREVSLDEVPSAAQNTITRTISDGTILKINQIFMIVKHTVRYSVEGEKDGKTFDFNVGPKGKVLVTENQ